MTPPRRVIRATLLGFGLLTAGCAYFPKTEPPPPTVSPRSVLDYCDWLNAATQEEIAEERRRLESDPSPAAPVVRSVSLALLLSLPQGGMDEVRALELLHGVSPAADRGDDPVTRQYRQFSVLWRQVLEERLQRDRETGDFAKTLAEEKQQARELQEHNRALQKQIEALKSIEQQMNRRGDNP